MMMRLLALSLFCSAMAAAGSTELLDEFPKAPIVNIPEATNLVASSKLPTVFMHGMGDSCFNPGMKSITEAVGKHVGTYSVCIPTGDDLDSDTNNGFFMTMNDNVDVWAKKIMNDTNLANGFNVVGFSQGNSVIRGYIQKYNNPPVSTFLSVHGTVVGVASFPKCNPSGLLGPVCKLISRFLVGPIAYTTFVQNKLFQADYFRDPKSLGESYKKNSQLAQWNNEGETADPKINENFAKVKRWAMVKAMKDSMIYPNDGEWWGAFDSDGKTRLAMNQTDWYKKDLFGLKAADEAGKIMFDSSPGDHLQFTEEELFAWVDKYFLE
jgi:palmitoyl-protein thioesterase